jgi:hypothetical protein
MPVIARDAVASDHLVYAWPLPIGPEDHEVSCADDELVVMCPAWLVGDRLGPGRHRWRTPDPSRPVSAYFVLTAPVEVSFDMITQFMVPTTHQPVRLRASGSLQVRCMDPGLLVAQFVGLPFDTVNDGVLRSVARSIERMLARLLTRRVVMAGTPAAVTDPQMLSNIVEELIAYNPTAGAVFGIELVRFGHMSVVADDGSRPWQEMGNGVGAHRAPTQRPAPEANLLETVRAPVPPMPSQEKGRHEQPTTQQPIVAIPTTNPGGRTKPPTAPPPIPSAARQRNTPPPGQLQKEVSGEIGAKAKQDKSTAPGHAAPAAPTAQTPVVPPPIPLPPSVPGKPAPVSSSSGSASGTLSPNRPMPSPVPRRAAPVEVQSTDEPTQPGIDIVRTPLPGSMQSASGEIGGPKPAGQGGALAQGTPPPKRAESEPSNPGEARGSILGIGVAHIGSSEVASGEITKKIAPGGRVLVPGPNGLMQSATVRQLLSGYYELEVGGSGETIWVPVTGVVPE